MHRHRRSHLPVLRRAVALAAALLSVACRGDDAGPEGATIVRDSSGVRIVTNRVPSGGFPAYATLTQAPTLVLDGGGPAAVVVGAVTLPDGRIAVAEAASRQIRFHGADGALLSTVGEGGDGAGRFGSVSRIGHVADDTVWVADLRGGQLVRVTPVGEVERHDFPRGLTVAGRFADDGYLMVPQWSSSLLGADWAEGVRRDSAAWAVWWPRQEAAARLQEFPHDEVMVLAGAEGESPVAAVPPFGRRTSRAVGPDGFWAGDQVTFEIRRYRPDGRLADILRLEGVDLTLTEALKQSVRPPRSEGDTALVDRLWRGVPPTRPAYTRLLLDRNGNLWVAEHVAGLEPPMNWLVFSPDGSALGMVSVPAGFDPLEIGADYVLGVERGEKVQRVARYGLARKGR